MVDILSPPLLDDSADTFYTHKLVHIVKPARLTNANTFYAPKVSQDAYGAAPRVMAGRRIGRETRVAAALKAGPNMRSRHKALPQSFTSLARRDRDTARRALGALNTTIAQRVLPVVEASGAGAAPADRGEAQIVLDGFYLDFGTVDGV